MTQFILDESGFIIEIRDQCPVCGNMMREDEIAAHMAKAHPNVKKAQKKTLNAEPINQTQPPKKTKVAGNNMELTLLDIRTQLTQNSYSSQEDIYLSLVTRVVQSLGWNIWKPSEVNPRIRVAISGEKIFLGLVLCIEANNPIVMVEIKTTEELQNPPDSINQSQTDNVLFLVFTNGQQWKFYCMPTNSNFSWGCFKSLDLGMDSFNELNTSFTRFLSKKAIQSGSAKKYALSSLKSVQKQRVVETVLPEAKNLITKYPFPSLPQAVVRLAENMGVLFSEEEVKKILKPDEDLKPKTDLPKRSHNFDEKKGDLSRRKVKISGILPPDGTYCRFHYKGRTYQGEIRHSRLVISGYEEFSTFSGASTTISGTNRNGWRDWECKLPGTTRWISADDWRKRQRK